MQKPRLRKVKQLAQGHRVKKLVFPGLEPGSLQLQQPRDLTKVTREAGASAGPCIPRAGHPDPPRRSPEPPAAPPGPAAAELRASRPARAAPPRPPARPPRGPRGPRPAGPAPPPAPAALTAVADDEQLEEVVVVPGHGGRGRRARAGGVGTGLANRSSLPAAPAAADPLPEQTAGTDRNTSLRSPHPPPPLQQPPPVPPPPSFPPRPATAQARQLAPPLRSRSPGRPRPLRACARRTLPDGVPCERCARGPEETRTVRPARRKGGGAGCSSSWRSALGGSRLRAPRPREPDASGRTGSGSGFGS